MLYGDIYPVTFFGWLNQGVLVFDPPPCCDEVQFDSVLLLRQQEHPRTEERLQALMLPRHVSTFVTCKTVKHII